MAGKLAAAQGYGILLVTANVGSLFEDVSPPSPCPHLMVNQVSAGHDSCVCPRAASELLSRINPRVRARPLECFSVVMKKLKLQEPSFSSSRTTSGSGQLSGLGESCVTQILKPRSSFRCGLRDLHPRGCCGVQLAPREKVPPKHQGAPSCWRAL